MKRKIDPGSKPYNRCLTCPHRKIRCDGPRTSAMTLQRWCEFMHDMKEANGLTNAYIAQTADVSIKTIERLMAQNVEQDIMRETARRIEDVIIGSSNQYPCYLAFEESAPGDAMKLHDSQLEIDHLCSQVERLKAEVDYLRLENDRKAKIIDKFINT